MLHVVQGGGIPHSLADSQHHKDNRDAQLKRANDRIPAFAAFVDVLVNFTDDVDADQIDVALSDAQVIVRRLQSAKQHAQMV